MYNVKGPSKFVTKTRRGLVQSLEVKSTKLFKEQNNNHIDEDNNCSLKAPKPVFKSQTRRMHNMHQNIAAVESNPVYLPQHQEIINYVSDSWNLVCSEIETANSSDGSTSPMSDQSIHSACYYEDAPADLSEFKPFDLESWWGQRLFTFITNSVNANS